jgi:hypothetical protein
MVVRSTFLGKRRYMNNGLKFILLYNFIDNFIKWWI